MPTDILFDANGDIDFSSGDIVYTESTSQHQTDLFINQPGDYKSAPGACIGGPNYLKGTQGDINDMLAKTRLQYSGDGMQVNLLQWVPATQTLRVNAPYK